MRLDAQTDREANSRITFVLENETVELTFREEKIRIIGAHPMCGELEKSFEGKTIVVTHHLPSIRSVSPRFKEDPLTPARVPEIGVTAWRSALIAQQNRLKGDFRS